MTEEREILTVEEAAKWLGVGRSKVYELIGRGELGVLRMGRRTCVPVSALRSFVERNVAPAGTRSQ